MSDITILQVEDDAHDVFLLQRAFVEAGIHNPVTVATDGQMAIDYLAGVDQFANRERFPLPGLVLLDLKLPRQSGREVLQWMRAHPSLRRTVIIVFTAAQYVGDIGLAYDLGVNSFVVKPVDFSQYLDIARLLRDWWLRYNQYAPLTEPARVAPFYPPENRPFPRLFSGPDPTNPS
jgi:CheY-like chemotaxis protein